MSKKEILLNYLNKHNGYIKRNELEKLNITRAEIDKFLENKIIRKVAHGLYIDNNLLEDDLYILLFKYKDIVYSYNTAFYIMGISEKIPSIYEATIPANKSIRNECGLKVHRLVKKNYELGIIEVNTACGNKVKIYDLERSICDIVKNEKEIETETANNIINSSFKEKKVDIDKLLEYAKKLNVYSQIKTLIGVMLNN